MKTKIKGFLAIVFALFMFSSMTTKAQCAKISNQTHCDMVVKVIMYSKTESGCNNICNAIAVAVPAGVITAVPCGQCSKICNIEVIVLSINGVSPGSTIIADYFNGYQPLPANRCGAKKLGYNSTSGYFEVLP